jgi:hypothetical protein
MLTVFWSVDGFHVVEPLPTDIKFNTTYFVEHMPLLTTRLEIGASKRRRILYRLHCDNPGPENSSRSRALTNDHGFQRIPHPPYSPDLAPSDFYLFGILKRQLENKEFVVPEDLLKTIVQILDKP